MSESARSHISSTASNVPQPTSEYGRGGPYPKDEELFDPLNGSPPGDWRVQKHVIGGNRDIEGSERERAVWVHPEWGAIEVAGVASVGDERRLDFAIDRHGPLSEVTVELDGNKMCRNVAYNTAVSIMENHA